MPCAEVRPASPELSGLAPVQLDALRELANIGAGHAATALSQMTGRSVDIGVPTVTLGPGAVLAAVAGRGPRPMLLVRLRSHTPLDGGLTVAFAERAAWELSNLLLSRDSSSTGWFDPLSASAIKEVGNVLGAAYLNALAQMTGWTIGLSTPDLVCMPPSWAAEMLTGTDLAGADVLCLETSFRVDGSADAVRGHVLLCPGRGVIPSLMAAIGLG